MIKNNNPKFERLPEIDFDKISKHEEKRRFKKQRRIRRREGVRQIIKNPLKAFYILLLSMAILGTVFFVIILVTISTRLIFNAVPLETFFSILAAMLLPEVEESEVNGFIAYLTETALLQRIGLYFLSCVMILCFVSLLWNRLLPWIGQPPISKSRLTEIENGIAVALKLSPDRIGYCRRPFLIRYNKSVAKSDVEEYIFWSGVSVEKWNLPDIKSEILHTLGGTSTEDFKNRVSKGSRRKRKEDTSIVIVYVIPGSVVAKRDGLTDDEI